MKRVFHNVKRFLINEDGPTTTEYGTFLALLVVVGLTSAAGLSEKVEGICTSVETVLPDGSGGGDGQGAQTGSGGASQVSAVCRDDDRNAEKAVCGTGGVSSAAGWFRRSEPAMR
jgi:Flp pilus assembly pilin Flp